MKKPRFKSHLRVESIEPNIVYLLSEHSSIVLKGSLYYQIAPFLDGNHTVGEIFSKLKGQIPLTDIYYALNKLKSKGYITESVNNFPPKVAAFWELLNVESQVAFKRLQEIVVSVTSFGDVPIEPFITALQSLGIQVRDSQLDIQDSKSLAVVLTDDYLQLDLQKFNQAAMEANRPWLLVKRFIPNYVSGSNCHEFSALRSWFGQF